MGVGARSLHLYPEFRRCRKVPAQPGDRRPLCLLRAPAAS
jgi:hypothetical protein